MPTNRSVSGNTIATGMLRGPVTRSEADAPPTTTQGTAYGFPSTFDRSAFNGIATSKNPTIISSQV
jgi:hypothetical protein